MSRNLNDLDENFKPEIIKFIGLFTGRYNEQPRPPRAEEYRSWEVYHGLSLLIYCTRRSPIEQIDLYCRGRSLKEIKYLADELREIGRGDYAKLLITKGEQPGLICTNAGPGQSAHNYGLAIDGVTMSLGRPIWGRTRREDVASWKLYGSTAEELDLEWGGRWQSPDCPHIQLAGFDWREMIMDCK